MVKNLPANPGDGGSIPEWGRPRGAGHGNPLQYSFLENPTDRGAWRATVHGIAELDTTEHKEMVQEEKMGSDCLMDTESLFGMMTMF